MYLSAEIKAVNKYFWTVIDPSFINSISFSSVHSDWCYILTKCIEVTRFFLFFYSTKEF